MRKEISFLTYVDRTERETSVPRIYIYATALADANTHRECKRASRPRFACIFYGATRTYVRTWHFVSRRIIIPRPRVDKHPVVGGAIIQVDVLHFSEIIGPVRWNTRRAGAIPLSSDAGETPAHEYETPAHPAFARLSSRISRRSLGRRYDLASYRFDYRRTRHTRTP